MNASRTVTRPFARRGVARILFVRVATAGCERRVGTARELVDPAEPELPPDCEADPPAGADGDDVAGPVAGRVGVVTIGGATGGVRGVVARGGAGVVTGGVVTVTGGVLTVTGGGCGSGGSTVVTGRGGGAGGGGSAVVIGSGGGGGSAVVMGNEGVVTVIPGRGGTSRASAWAAIRPAKAAARPQRPPKRDIPICTTGDP